MQAVIVAGGDPDPSDARWLADADLLVAADSGACWLDELGVTPDLLVGDLDSIGEPLLASSGGGRRPDRAARSRQGRVGCRAGADPRRRIGR